jgi:N-acetylglucosamine kinase-like BadF-type ATPase
VDLVIGVDAGGTTTRVTVADAAGRVVGTARTAGINQNSSGGDRVAALASALSTATADVDRSAVRRGVLAVAGAGEAGYAAAVAEASRSWARAGLPGEPAVVPDVLATFAAGTAEGDGRVLVAGTGAIAAAVEAGRIARRADGYGWLLGDHGSAVWLAREGLTAALAAIDGRARPTMLRTRLLEALLGHGRPYEPQDVVAAVYAEPPARIGAVAPVVTACASEGDEVAADIVARGVEGLLASLDAVGACSGSRTTPSPSTTGARSGCSTRSLARRGSIESCSSMRSRSCPATGGTGSGSPGVPRSPGRCSTGAWSSPSCGSSRGARAGTGDRSRSGSSTGSPRGGGAPSRGRSSTSIAPPIPLRSPQPVTAWHGCAPGRS